MDDAVYLIDSTSLTLSARSADWARFSDQLSAVKTHVIYDDAADRPIYAVVSTANVNDITAAKAMPIVPHATHVFAGQPWACPGHDEERYGSRLGA